ncbi:MAG: histidine kinase dimerization/phosphoacceptor domain -containing protein [Spirochaetota bacterium]
MKSILVFNFILAAVLPIISFGLFSLRSVIVYLKDDIKSKNLLIAHTLSSDIQLFLNEAENLLYHIGDMVGDRKTVSDDSFETHAALTIKRYDFFEQILRIDNQGTVQNASPHKPEYIGMNMLGHQYYKESLHSRKPEWSKSLISTKSGDPSVAVAVPFKNCVITGQINLKRLNAITGGISIGKSGFAIITDSDGIVLAHRNSLYVRERVNLKNLEPVHRALSGEEGTYYYKDQSGVSTIGSFALIEKTRWVVGIVQPVSEAHALMNRILLILASGTLLSLLLALSIAVLSRRRILQPISSLILSANRVAAGDYEFSFPEKNYFEVNELAAAFYKSSQAIKARESALLQSKEEYRELVENAGSVIIRWDLEGRLTFFNEYAEKYFGYKKEEILGQSLLGTIVPFTESTGRSLASMIKNIITNPAEYKNNQNEVIKKNGERFWVQWSNIPIYDKEERLIEILSIGNDITYIKEAETKLKASLHEKEILLKEIHHRVKNNMQVILSLLNLQAGEIRDAKDMELIKMSQNRVYSMSLVHEMLYKSEDLSRINMEAYITDLAGFLLSAFGKKKDDIIIEIKSKDIIVSIDIAIPCGLIINEAISNSLKYAFTEKQKGVITIELSRGNGTTILKIADNGSGIRERPDFPLRPSFGLELMSALVEQLNGTLSIERNGGTTVCIKF